MKARLTLILVWILAGAGAVGGSILGAAGGRTTLFLGALVGGVVGAPLGVLLSARLGWLEPWQRRTAAIGAILGFLVAAPVAAMNLHTPITPVLICSLAGVGALLGAGRGKRA